MTRVLEKARRDKVVGHPLDADVTLYAQGELHSFLKGYLADLREIFIVSRVNLADGPAPAEATASELAGLSVAVAGAEAEKCALLGP